MAAEAEQQLSLVPEASVQGSLFGDAPPTAPAASPAPTPTAATATAGAPAHLDPEALAADAAARPRQRRQPGASSGSGSAATSSANSPTTSADTDLPPWHHHGLVEPDQLTPMLRHYVELKRAHPERLLLYRLGDFFECFFEDALTVSRLLELTLTGKEGGKAIGRVPMAGIPHHAAERYCAELVRRGLSVALCDQLEEASARSQGRGELLRRDITRVITPGTVLEEGMLAARRNNWLCAVVLEGPAGAGVSAGTSAARWGLAVADVSTGEFRVSERGGSDALHQELLQLEAAEVLWPGGGETAPPWCPTNLRLTRLPRTPFETPEASATLKERFGLASLDGLGLGEVPLALRAAGGLVHYLDSTQNGANPSHGNGSSGERALVPLDLPTTWHAGDALVLDAATRRNLELTRTQLGGSLHGSLLWAIDRTHTAMGGRCLRRWLEAPLVARTAILERQGGVSELVGQRPLRLAVRRLLRPMADLERLAGRAGAGSASARDLVALADGLERLPQLAALLAGAASAPLQALARPWPQLAELADALRHTLVESPPLALSEGGLIHDGVDAQLDGLRNQLDDQDAWLAGQEAAERRLSGIGTLRLQHHRTFGYFLAVSRAKAAAVPEHWIRRQTLANEERFVTPELKAREGRIQQLRARAAQREYELFCALRGRVGEQAAAIRTAARLVAELDAIAGLAEVAATGGYCCPQITDPGGADARVLQIEAGRHPVVEQLLAGEGFTANGIALGGASAPHPGSASASSAEGPPDLLILTGPNASGKSCYLRQTGLLQLMAQMGSWIPARSARLGIADRLFTRVGAGDDLAAGQSTFMVEMAETANILHHATARSLVLLDEIGRGTATFDGLSIAWAVAEHLATAIGARCVFATHYHELNALAGLLANVANARVLVEETGHDLRFLHRVVPGGASRSYGIEAARLAGVPAPVVLRARQVLGRIEANSQISLGQPEPGEGNSAAEDPGDGALAA